MKKILETIKRKWAEYLLEIIVITIGILGAFILNNWNESRKLEKLEIQYLTRLKSDLSSDTVYFKRRISDSESWIDRHSELLIQLYKHQKSFEDVKKIWGLMAWDSEQLTVQYTTHIELINSGHLNIFRNQKLKESIINYYKEIEGAKAHIMEFNEYSTRHLIQLGNVIPNSSHFHPLYDDLNDSTSMVNTEWDFINNPSSVKFQTTEYTVFIYYAKYKVFLTYFTRLKDLSTQLIKNIQTELDSRK